MKLEPGLQRTGPFDVDVARRRAEQAGYLTFVLPTGVVDRVTFFDAVSATFPLDPPLVGTRSWDALADSLWEGLSTQAVRRIAILWPGASAMAASAPADFDIAVDVLGHVATLLGDPHATANNPKQVTVLVEAI